MEEQRNLNKTNQPFRIKLADRIIEIHPLYSEICRLCQDYMVSDSLVPDRIVTITWKDIEWEEEAVRREEEKNGITSDHSPAYLETVAVYRKIAAMLVEFQTVMMHGSVISTAGQGYMITARSGIGKTTRTRLWTECVPDSFVVNGDKPLLRVTDSAVYAYGTPWCGKEGWNTNIAVPLRVIFMLERSDSGNSVTEMSFAEAFPMLMKQTFKPDDINAKRKAVHLLQKMAGKVKVYRFFSEPTEEAVQMAWKAASKNR